MSLSSTHLDATAIGCPEPMPLPSSKAPSRRAVLFGSAAVASVTASAAMPAIGHAAPLSPNDARLVALADAYEAVERRCNEHTAAHRHLTGEAEQAADEAFDDLASQFLPIEEELAATPAATMVGLLAKARAVQMPTARAFDDCSFALSIVDDLWRLFGQKLQS